MARSFPLTIRRILPILLVLCLLAGCGSGAVLDEAYTEEYEPETLGFTSVGTNTRLSGYASDKVVLSGRDVINTAGISSSYIFLLDLTAKTALLSRNYRETVDPAGLIKWFTVSLALSQLKLTDTVTITEDAKAGIGQGLSSVLQVGDELTVKDLAACTLMTSANDTAQALAIAAAGSLDAFVTLMNDTAAARGASKTVFVNATGLPDENQYSTLYDMYLILAPCFTDDTFLTLLKDAEYTADVRRESGREAVTWETGFRYFNGQLLPPSGFTMLGGVASGSEGNPNILLTLSTTADGTRYLAIIRGADTREMIYQEMNQLLYKINEIEE